MNRAIYTAASGGMAALARLDIVAQNLANVGTAGYKADHPVFQVRPLEASGAGASDPVRDRAAVQVLQVATVRDYSQGPVRQSGNPLDVALSRPGFFVVATPRGERYTRQGTFTLDDEGFLVTRSGERVQGSGGDVRVGVGTPAIGTDGTVAVDGAPVGTLRVVDFGPEPALVAEGNALFAAAPGAVAQPIPPGEVDLDPEAIEGANIDAVAAMIELVDVVRGFETYMHTLQRLDQVTERAINEVGRG